MTTPKRFDRFIASIDHDEYSSTRVTVTNRSGPAVVRIQPGTLLRPLSGGVYFCLTPDEAESLAAFLKTAVGAIRQEQR